MRIPIWAQLAAVVVLAVGVALTIVSIPTWGFVNNFVVGVSKDALLLTASLKASRVTNELRLIHTAVQTISTRVTIQNALENYYDYEVNGNRAFGDTIEGIFKNATDDLKTALSNSGFSGLLQARIYSRNTTGNPSGLVGVIGNGATESGSIILPYRSPDGGIVHLADPTYGFPPALYPNITYIDRGRQHPSQKNTNLFSAVVFDGVSLGNASERTGVLLGPMIVNSTFALMSLTIPVRKLNHDNFTLGYLTVVASSNSMVKIQQENEGLGRTGRVLFLGSTNQFNHFNVNAPASNESYSPPLEHFKNQTVRFLFPPVPSDDQHELKSRQRQSISRYRREFKLEDYPAVLEALRVWHPSPFNAISHLSTTTELGDQVAVGVARPQTNLASWVIVVEQDASEAYEPIATLRTILLGCVFGTLGLILLIVFPFAYWSVNPIRRLKEATENSSKSNDQRLSC
jgi:osomolarity two-component system sensor histidine kinase SLN1